LAIQIYRFRSYDLLAQRLPLHYSYNTETSCQEIFRRVKKMRTLHKAWISCDNRWSEIWTEQNGTESFALLSYFLHQMHPPEIGLSFSRTASDGSRSSTGVEFRGQRTPVDVTMLLNSQRRIERWRRTLQVSRASTGGSEVDIAADIVKVRLYSMINQNFWYQIMQIRRTWPYFEDVILTGCKSFTDRIDSWFVWQNLSQSTSTAKLQNNVIDYAN
jgi:hypothetical protein